MAHAILGASSSDRWLACPPSARLAQQFPDKSSPYAAAGTLAHAIGECEIARWLGQITDEAHAVAMLQLKADEHYSESLQQAVNEYVELAKRLVTEARAVNPDAQVFLEQRLDFSEWVPEGFGTGDLVIVCDGLIQVCDYKNGSGLLVEAQGNSQMRLYALGALKATDGLFSLDKVSMTICQPNKDNISTETITVEELLAWGESIKATAQLAWDGAGEFAVGDHCRFCPAKGTCRARAEANLSIKPTDPRLLSLEEVAALLEQAKQLKTWASDLEDYAFEEAVSGRTVPGYKLVAGRSNRKYSDPDAVAERLKAAGFAEAVLYERSLLGITAMEKVVGKKAFTELLDGLIDKPEGAPTLVPASDKREAISRPSILDGFEFDN